MLWTAQARWVMVMLCYVMLWNGMDMVMLCYVMLCYGMKHANVLIMDCSSSMGYGYVMLCYVMEWNGYGYVMLCYVIDCSSSMGYSAPHCGK